MFVVGVMCHCRVISTTLTTLTTLTMPNVTITTPIITTPIISTPNRATSLFHKNLCVCLPVPPVQSI